MNAHYIGQNAYIPLLYDEITKVSYQANLAVVMDVAYPKYVSSIIWRIFDYKKNNQYHQKKKKNYKKSAMFGSFFFFLSSFLLDHSC